MTSDGENLKWKSDFSKGNHPKRTPSEFSQKFLIRCRTPRPRSLSSSRLPTVGGAQGRKIRNELGKETVGGFVVCQLLCCSVFFRLETDLYQYHGFRRFQMIYFDRDFLPVGLKFSPVQSP